eukprot:6469488-Amphidinium_carterae.1
MQQSRSNTGKGYVIIPFLVGAVLSHGSETSGKERQEGTVHWHTALALAQFENRQSFNPDR